MDLSVARPSRPFPLPSDMPPLDRLRPFWRCVGAMVLGEIQQTSAAEQLKQRWPTLHARAATMSATTTTSGWAAQLAGTTVADLLTNLAPRSGAARLFERGTLIDMTGTAVVSIPIPSPTLAPSFVLEGSPVPVVQDTFGSAALGPPKKLAFLEVFTSEIANASA